MSAYTAPGVPKKGQKTRPAITAVLNVVALAYGLSAKNVLAKGDNGKLSRKGDNPMVRYITAFIAVNKYKYTPAQAAKVLKIDRACAYHGLKTVANIEETNKAFSRKVRDIEKTVNVRLGFGSPAFLPPQREVKRIQGCKVGLTNLCNSPGSFLSVSPQPVNTNTL